jgi:hypothetical protein
MHIIDVFLNRLQEKPHKCSLCSKSFPTPGDLKAHMYVHTGTWPYRCTICSRGFSKQTNLKNHLHLHESGALEAEEEAVQEDLEEEEEDEEVAKTTSEEDSALAARMGPLSDFLLQMVKNARSQEEEDGLERRGGLGSKSSISSDDSGGLETRIKGGFPNLFRPINM